jgi:hypothetical protein
MSQILRVDDDVYSRATMLARQLEALCLFTSVARERFDMMADGSRDDLLSLTCDLSRDLCQNLINMHQSVSAREQAKVTESAAAARCGVLSSEGA